MFRKSKIEPVEKVKIVVRYLAGEIGIQQAGKELGVDHHSIQMCIRDSLRYEKNQKREDVKSHHYIISFDPVSYTHLRRTCPLRAIGVQSGQSQEK